jgi:UDP:flavonoid glycosyltransferase YjiC (YdhE family)
MRILFSSRPAYGHVYPLMPLAAAMRDAGHEVHVATAGDFVARVRALGFPTHDVGLTIEQGVEQVTRSVPGSEMPRGHDGRPDLRYGAMLFLDVLARRTAADLVSVLDDVAPDTVVYEQYEYGAAIAAHARGIPAICHSLSPRMSDDVLAFLAAGRLERLWDEHGVQTTDFDLFTGDRFLDTFPAALQQPSFVDDPARVRMRPVPFAEPGATLPGWVGARARPLVYLTLGTVVATDEVLAPAVEGLGRLDADILLALGSAGGAGLGTIPANVHVEPFVDQAALIPVADLVVHHGGSGTVLAALAHGTPQVLLPKGADQFHNADLVVAAGLAPALEPAQATPDAVAALATATMAERRPVLDAVRAEIAALPHPADVVEPLLAAVAPHPAGALR